MASAMGPFAVPTTRLRSSQAHPPQKISYAHACRDHTIGLVRSPSPVPPTQPLATELSDTPAK